MSFSNDINKELSRVKISSKLEALLELSSILKTNASISIRNAFIFINFFTESGHVVNRISKLLNYLYQYEPQIKTVKNNNILKDGIYNLTIEDEKIVNNIVTSSGVDYFGNYTTDINILYERIISIGDKGVSAFLRGVFLGSGSMVDPNKNYHLEFVLTNKEDLELLLKVLHHANMDVLTNTRKNKNVIYIKNSEMIADFLNIIDANNALLALENVKVEKDIRNNINRKLNFDMANLSKTIQSALEQIKYIEIIEENSIMPEDLKEIAFLRKTFPEVSLKELGEMAEKPLSKSTVAYKLNKIKNIAKTLDKRVWSC